VGLWIILRVSWAQRVSGPRSLPETEGFRAFEASRLRCLPQHTLHTCMLEGLGCHLSKAATLQRSYFAQSCLSFHFRPGCARLLTLFLRVNRVLGRRVLFFSFCTAVRCCCYPAKFVVRWLGVLGHCGLYGKCLCSTLGFCCKC